MADLTAGQKINVVTSTTHMHECPEVSEAEAVVVTIPEDRVVEEGEFGLFDGFFGVALNGSEDGSEDGVVVQIKFAEYETDQIDTADSFLKGTEMYWNPGQQEFDEAAEAAVSDITYSDTGSTMITNLETALDTLLGAGNYTVAEEDGVTEEYSITIDTNLGEVRLTADLSGLTGSGDVSFERTQAYSGDNDTAEVYTLIVGNATGSDLELSIEFLYAGRVSVKKDSDDIVWFILAPMQPLDTPAIDITETLS